MITKISDPEIENGTTTSGAPVEQQEPEGPEEADSGISSDETSSIGIKAIILVLILGNICSVFLNAILT